MNDLALHGVFAVGGGLGAMARLWMSRAITHDLPLATLLVNVLGSFALGLGLAIMGDPAGWPAENQRLIFGFCGGFTTFSTFAYQTLELRQTKSLAHAAGNILLSLVTCFAAFWIALKLPEFLGA